MKEDNVILERSFTFAVRIVKLQRCLTERGCDRSIIRQLLKSGTSIGANVREGTQAASRPDFVNKLSIALKESVETEYWLELLFETEYLTETEFRSIYAENQELTRLLTAIINTTKRNDKQCSN